MAFVGRTEQLHRLQTILTRVESDDDAKPGKAALIRGRRRVGKSRLVEEFIERARAPHVFFTASGRPTGEELRLFGEAVRTSDLPEAHIFDDVTLESWDAALRLLAAATAGDPCVIVIDELPYLTFDDPAFEGTLQKQFDRVLSRQRILLLGIGSDLAMMEALNDYGRPFHQRATEMVVPPFSPAEVGSMLDLDAADAFDAFLVTGGLPLICAEWRRGDSLDEYLQEAVTNPTSALLVSAERSLAAEFPATAQARTILGVIGNGERRFTNIGRAAGGIQQASLSRSLNLLLDKRVIAADVPISTRPQRDKRYRVADPYLRFWLSFLGPNMPEIERGRGDRVLARVRESWTSWRGRAIEPVVRDALDRLPGPTAIDGVVGGYWTRTNDPEIDVVVADRWPPVKRVLAVGSIKWLENAPFDERNLAQLIAHRSQLPGASLDTPMLAISRSGSTVDGITTYTPESLIAAWDA